MIELYNMSEPSDCIRVDLLKVALEYRILEQVDPYRSLLPQALDRPVYVTVHKILQ